MSMPEKKVMFGGGTLRSRGSYENREQFKGGIRTSGFSCGLGNQNCDMFRAREGFQVSTEEPLTGSLFNSQQRNSGTFFGNLGPKNVSGSPVLTVLSESEKQKIAQLNQLSNLTKNSDLTNFTNNRIVGGQMISDMRDSNSENFRGRTFFPRDEMEPFVRTGNIMDYSKENFNNRCSRENMARRNVYQPQTRNKMIEQYMTKIPATKGGGLRAQYGL